MSKRRDAATKACSEHYCDNITRHTQITPGKWRENFLNCRQCKRNLVLFLGNFFLSKVQDYLHPHQTLYVAGCFEGDLIDTAWFVRGNNRAEPDPLFSINAEEMDMRVWLHATNTVYQKILILSPDTDVYQIGLPLQCVTIKQIIVQVSAMNSYQLRLLNLTALVQALQNDPDLAHLHSSALPKTLQVLYVASGCDYTSFFSGLGKGTFLRYFLQYASFISGSVGALSATGLIDMEYQQGYLAFLCLIGTVYFKRHSTGFDTPSPATHFQSFHNPTLTALQQHSAWLDDIQQNIWYRVKFENEMIPSVMPCSNTGNGHVGLLTCGHRQRRTS